MKTKISECATLGEYRREILQLPQHEVARLAKCQQGWISQVELGHLPAPWKRDELLKAYKLEARPREFERMILNAQRMKALQKPMRQTEPLLCVPPANSEAAPIIGLVEQMKRVARGEIEAADLIRRHA